MTAVERAIFIEQGATFTMGFNWLRESPPGSGTQVPYDLTGCICRMQIRKTQQAAILINATSADTTPMIVLVAATGRIDVKIPAAATSILTLKSALYDLEMQMQNGDVHRLLKGTVGIDPNITQVLSEPILE